MISARLRRSLEREFRQSRMAQVGALILVVIFITTAFAPFFAPHDPTEQRIGTGTTEDMSYLPPPVFSTTENVTVFEDGERVTREVTTQGNWSFVLGTDRHGRDILSRILYGGRVSLSVGLVGAALAALIGVPWGLAAGFAGGRVDDTLMRWADVMLAFPSLVLAIALVGIFRGTPFHTRAIGDPFVWAANSDFVPNILIPRAGHVAEMPESMTFPVTVTIVVALVNTVWFARVARGEAISVREEDYIKAARSMGTGKLTILRKHVLPNSMTPIIVLATIQVAAIILLESALSYLGFSGISLSWGQDIQRGQSDLRRGWWMATMPGLAIVAAVVAVNLVGDWLRDALDPSIEGEGGV